MKTARWPALVFAVLLFVGTLRSEDKPAEAKAGGGFEPLFNGKDLTGWEGDTKLWSAENGEIVGKSPGLKYNDFLASTESFGDFVLKFKFKVVNTSGQANSGMQFRSQRVPNSHEMSGYQADVGQGYWGAIYDESRRNKVLAQAPKEEIQKAVKQDDWNEYTIECSGDHIVLTLNPSRLLTRDCRTFDESRTLDGG